MDPKPEQVAAFGQEARRRREALGLTTEDVAARVTEILGREVKRQSVTQWENGQGSPRQEDKLAALDEALEAGGELAALLAPRLVDEVAELRDRLSRLEAEIARLVRRPR